MFMVFLLTGCAEIVTVERVIDGDSIVLEGGDRVRILGIQTPEKKEEGFQEGKDYAEKYLMGKKIKLIRDETINNTDWYGRLLRYIEIEEGNYSEMIIQECLATPYGKHNNKAKFQDIFDRNCD